MDASVLNQHSAKYAPSIEHRIGAFAAAALDEKVVVGHELAPPYRLEAQSQSIVGGVDACDFENRGLIEYALAGRGEYVLGDVDPARFLRNLNHVAKFAPHHP